MRISLHCLFLWSVQRVREPMVGEGCCDCLVDSRQGHAGHAAVNTAQRAVSVLKITPAFWHCTSSFAFDSTGCTVAIAWADVLKYSTACTLCISLPCAQQQLSN